MSGKFMKRSSYFLGLILIANVAFAEQPADGRESWYLYWGLGGAAITYPKGVQEAIDIIEDVDGVQRTTISIDMLGFYFPLTPKTIGGVVINSAGDRFDYEDTWFQWNQFLYGASVIHYVGQRFGQGPFLRADAGLAKMNYQNSEDNSIDSENGFGALVGGGISFDLGGTRILLNLNYSFRKVEGDNYQIIGFSVGGLF
ncbi:MAG: hypothetical protein WC703_01215 [Candidatus Neomarinimicrobiota bacterium]